MLVDQQRNLGLERVRARSLYCKNTAFLEGIDWAALTATVQREETREGGDEAAGTLQTAEDAHTGTARCNMQTHTHMHAHRSRAWHVLYRQGKRGVRRIHTQVRLDGNRGVGLRTHRHTRAHTGFGGHTYAQTHMKPRHLCVSGVCCHPACVLPTVSQALMRRT